jgi:hypothetical protein
MPLLRTDNLPALPSIKKLLAAAMAILLGRHGAEG